MASTSLRILPALLFAAATSVRAQELRYAALDADFVAVARQVGAREEGEHHELHTLQIVRAVRGGPATAPKTVTVIDYTDVRLHFRPTPRQSRLYCLHDGTKAAEQMGLAADKGPYFTMSQRAGSNPLVGADLDADPTLRFCNLLLQAERGEQPAQVAQELVTTALSDHAPMRLEATRLLAERPLTAARVADVQWGELLARTSAETEDIDYKLALFELCATRRLPGLVEAMLVSLDKTQTPQFARAVGRLCFSMLGEGAATPIVERLSINAEPGVRKALLLALGATRTPQALDALTRMKQTNGSDPAIEAALREHSGKAAQDAVESRDDAKPQAPDKRESGGK